MYVSVWMLRARLSQGFLCVAQSTGGFLSAGHVLWPVPSLVTSRRGPIGRGTPSMQVSGLARLVHDCFMGMGEQLGICFSSSRGSPTNVDADGVALHHGAMAVLLCFLNQKSPRNFPGSRLFRGLAELRAESGPSRESRINSFLTA